MKTNQFKPWHKHSPLRFVVIGLAIGILGGIVGLAYSEYCQQRDNADRLRLTACVVLSEDEWRAVKLMRARLVMFDRLTPAEQEILRSK